MENWSYIYKKKHASSFLLISCPVFKQYNIMQGGMLEQDLKSDILQRLLKW